MTHGKILGTYISFVLIICSLLGGYVACGARTYRVVIDDDMNNPSHTHSGLASTNTGANLIGLHSLKGWGPNLPIHYKIANDMKEANAAQLQNAMTTWENAVGKKLFQFDGIDDKIGSDFASLYDPLKDVVNGHYFDLNWVADTKKSKNVLATTIWENSPHDETLIVKADIRYNFESFVFGDSIIEYSQGQRTIVDLESLALHELGHLLGLAHITIEEDRHSVMNPALFIGEGMITRRLSNGDIERIRSIYGVGDPELANNLEKADDYSEH